MNEREETREPSNSLVKMLGVIDLFDHDKPIWSTNEIIDALEASRSTGYRYIKALNTAGLLNAVGNGHYVLGPRIIELDLLMRGTDPLIQASKGVLEQLADSTGNSALLCTLYRNSVVCIRDQLAPLNPEHLFSRGQRRSLFRGAISKVILAYLPNHRLRSIYARKEQEVAEANLGASWAEFRQSLAKIRRAGHVISYGEFNPGVVGIAAPVYNSENVILGSVGIALVEEELRDVNVNQLVLTVKRAAREITTKTVHAIPGMDLLPRAVG